tara:strand:- start:2123 stop:2731 length:609 start_codon:yes stop_codon:yes gene_type:complete
VPITKTEEFLDKFSRDNSYYLSLPFLWSVEIPGLAGLTSAIDETTSKIANQGSWKTGGNAGGWGAGNILAARQVTIPPEQSTFLETGQQSRGGFMPGYGLQQRESFLSRNLAVNFIETIDDIVHLFFTPWAVALGVDGLTNFKLKTNILVKQYDNQLRVRKGYKFIDAFPTNVEGFTVTQEPEAVFPEKSVTFCFTDFVPDD